MTTRATPLGLLGVSPTLSTLDARRAALARRSEEHATARETFLRGLAGGTPSTPEQRARWSALANTRVELELELECLELERLRVVALQKAVRAAPVVRWARYAGREAERHAREAEGLLGQLRRKLRELVEVRQHAKQGGLAHG